jgi:hypothetical protein
MKKTLPILALLLTSCTSDVAPVGRYQYSKDSYGTHWIFDTKTCDLYWRIYTNRPWKLLWPKGEFDMAPGWPSGD